MIQRYLDPLVCRRFLKERSTIQLTKVSRRGQVYKEAPTCDLCNKNDEIQAVGQTKTRPKCTADVTPVVSLSVRRVGVRGTYLAVW